MSIRLIIDTCADLTNDDLDKSVYILPITVTIDGKEYIPFTNLSNEEFYSLQKTAKSFPHTSQVPLKVLYDTFTKCLDNKEDVLAIFMGSAHSGTFNTAMMVKSTIESERGAEQASHIHIIDSKNVTFPYGALVFEAFKMIRENKMTVSQIEDRINYLVPRVHMRAFIDDLIYLKKGGRISGVTAVFGNLLNFKVVIKTGENKIEPTDKVRGLQKALLCIIETANKEDIDYSLPCYIGHTNIPERAEKLYELTLEKTNLKPKQVISIGPTVGTHVGEGSTGLCWFVK